MKLNITYSVDFELERVLWTINKLDWYAQNGYIPLLPRNINKNSITTNILNSIKNEYVEMDYKNITKKLELEFNKINADFLIKLKIKFEKIPSSINVKLTKYGTMGSYYLPNTITININHQNIIKVVIHEIVHLLAEPYVKEKKLTHQEKEELINSILKEINM